MLESPLPLPHPFCKLHSPPRFKPAPEKKHYSEQTSSPAATKPSVCLLSGLICPSSRNYRNFVCNAVSCLFQNNPYGISLPNLSRLTPPASETRFAVFFRGWQYWYGDTLDLEQYQFTLYFLIHVEAPVAPSPFFFFFFPPPPPVWIHECWEGARKSRPSPAPPRSHLRTPAQRYVAASGRRSSWIILL